MTDEEKQMFADYIAMMANKTDSLLAHAIATREVLRNMEKVAPPEIAAELAKFDGLYTDVRDKMRGRGEDVDPRAAALADQWPDPLAPREE